MSKLNSNSAKLRIVLFLLGVAAVGIISLLVFRTPNSDKKTVSKKPIAKNLITPKPVVPSYKKPSESQIEAHYKDKAGSVPISLDFDADPGELCGNGKSLYHTSLPPDKPVPASWKPPPRPGSDPSYEGPGPFDEFKESPHSMPASKRVFARGKIVAQKDRELPSALKDALKRFGEGKIGFFGVANSDDLKDVTSRLVASDLALLDTKDELGLANKLKAEGIKYILYDRTIIEPKPWIEEGMDKLSIKMRDTVPMEHFQPLVLGSHYALYVLSDPFEISKDNKGILTKRVRDLLTGLNPEKVSFDLPLTITGVDEHRVVVSLRKRNAESVRGQKLIRRLGKGKTVIEALDNATKRVISDWEPIVKAAHREFGIKLSSDKAKALDEIEIEIDLIYQHCQITDRNPTNLMWYLELGIHGVMLESKGKNGKSSVEYLEPSYATHREIQSEVIFLERMLSKSNLKEFLRPPKRPELLKVRPLVLNETNWINDQKHRFKSFKVINWIERPKEQKREIVEIYRGVPIKKQSEVSRESLINSLKAGAGWLMRNQSPDGQYAYQYTPMNKNGKRWMEGGNIVRHALNPYTLLMVNKLSPNAELVASAKRGIDFTLKFLRHEGSRCVICHRDPPARYYNAKLNAVAVTVLSILKLGDVANIDEYKDALQCMAEEILFMQDKNGHFWQYDVPPNHPYYGAESTIAAGEFIFALAKLYQHYGDEKYKKAADLAIDFYTAQWERMEKEKTASGIYDEEHRVNLIGIVPWLVTAMESMHRKTGELRYAELGFEMQDWIDNTFFWWPNRAQYPDYIGSSFKMHWELPAINSCQYSEGAAAAYAISLRTGRDIERRRDTLIKGMRFCLQLQFDSYDNTFFLPVPEEAMGGYRYTLGHSRLRNDYSYHAMAAIAQAAEYLRPEDYH